MYTRQVLHNAQLKTQAITLQGASATPRASVEQVCCRVLISRVRISRARKQGPGAAAAQFLRLPPVAPTTAPRAHQTQRTHYLLCNISSTTQWIKWLCYATCSHKKLSLSERAKQIDLTSLSLPCPGRKRKKCHMVKSFPSPFHCTFQAPPCSECHNRHIILKGRTPF